jgi:CO/xanthine dehydrogenase Mo-binding subunit
VHVAKLVNAVDCGTPVNPRIVETQISGAATMQLGFTLFEKINLDNGQITNASLADYKIPGIADLPPIMLNDAIDAYQTNAPFGAKGVGESSTMPVSPAIANAIDDAIGVRLTELPLTAEAVFRALRAKEGRPLEDA